jgi:hypothetical protein
MKRLLLCLAAVLMTAHADDLLAQANYDEAKVPQYKLPDPLVMADGTKVTDAETWRTKRRPELLELFATQMFGKLPTQQLEHIKYDVLDDTKDALDGKARRRQIAVYFAGKSDGPKMEILLYTPAGAKAVPCFLGLNFEGNHAVNKDPGIRITKSWMRNNPKEGIENNQASEKTRGHEASRWQVEKVLAAGYGVATIYYGDIDPDFDDGFQNGVHPLFYKEGQMKPAPDEWGSIGAWAWGLSRALDYLETEKDLIDAKRVAVIGHSRLGKTSLWAGANDERFSIVISNNSGEGGAAITRRRIGETIAVINKAFPHWFCDNFNNYSNKEDELPIDAHELVALSAPRPVYVASAVEDRWADPRGEFLACLHADPVYKLLGAEGLPTKEMPAIDTPVQGTLGYHIRTGEHDVTAYDWDQYLKFAKKHWKK